MTRREPASGAALCLIAALAAVACSGEPGTRSVLKVGFGDTLAVQVRLPAGYDSARAYPILIGLHGRGGRADWFLRLWDEVSRHQAIFLVPEAPYPFDGGFAWFRNRPPDSLRISRDRARSEALVAAVARTALARYKGEEAYLLGFSQGGNLAYHAGLGYREVFRGVIAVGTYLDANTIAPEKSRGAGGLKAFVVHGREDRVIAFQEGEAAYRYLKSLGSRAVFREAPGGHEVDGASLAEALDWMLPETRGRMP